MGVRRELEGLRGGGEDLSKGDRALRFEGCVFFKKELQVKGPTGKEREQKHSPVTSFLCGAAVPLSFFKS